MTGTRRSAVGELAAAPVRPPTEVHVLSSGLRAALRPSRANDIVALKVYLPMGPLHETPDESGLSNLLQEMLLHGTLDRTEDAIQDALADLGAKLGTSAGGNYGSVSLRVARGQLSGALDLLDEVLTRPALAEEEAEKERVRVLNRIKAQDDSLLTAAFEQFRETFYEGHPYHKPILGYPDTVPRLGTVQLREARARFFRHGALVVAAVGHFDPDDLLGRLERLDLPGGEGVSADEPPGRVALERSREVERRRDSQAAWFVLGFPAPSYVDPDYPAARLLDAVLGGSMNSRLFTELREKRSLAYQVSSFYNDQPSHSYLAGYIGTSPDKFDEAREAMLREFRRLADELVSEDELRRAQRYLHGTYIISAETNAAQASRLGRYELHGLGQDFGDRMLERIATVTPSEVRALAERWFGAYVLAAVRPGRGGHRRRGRSRLPPPPADEALAAAGGPQTERTRTEEVG
ncbi:MAG: M16 family metallopeptidase [Gemmatimonadota bacterium]